MKGTSVLQTSERPVLGSECGGWSFGEAHLEKQYMREQLRRARKPAPRVIGIDEIAIRKGHTYRIVIRDRDAVLVRFGTRYGDVPLEDWVGVLRDLALRIP